MSATSMTITTFKKVAVLLPPRTSILLRANHGVGKSAVQRQVRDLLLKDNAELGDFEFMDKRAGQMSEGDVIGLPSTDGRVTRFNPPDWLQRACDKPCFLFLDELNRGTLEVMQAFFQIALDHEMNGAKLHPLTRVACAINTNAQYVVNEMDPALLDRFYCVDLEPTVDEFCAWARSTDKEQGGNLHYFIPDFIQMNEQWLYPPKNVEPGSVSPTPRAWEFTGRALEHAGIMEDPDNDLFYQICRGFIGNEAAIAFRDFCKNVDSRITGDDVVNHFHEPKVRAKVERQTQDRQLALIGKVADYVIKNCTKLTDRQGENLRDFMQVLPEELRIDLWSKTTLHGIDKIDLAKSIHKWCAAAILDVFGVPMGQAGVGITPNIPGIFRTTVADNKK